MPFLNSSVPSRQFVLLCARLLVQCAMGWSTPQAGPDDWKYFRLVDSTADGSIVRNERELMMPICTSRQAALRAVFAARRDEEF